METELPSDTPATGSEGPVDDRDAVIDGVVFFWRPGCGFCSSLRSSLRSRQLPLHEVNIWEDPRAAEAVRAITGGNETVPTVVIGEVTMVNPSAHQVLAAVTEHAPHLLRSP